MDDEDTSEQCEQFCLPNCEETAYAYTTDTSVMNVEELCSEETNKEALLSFPYNWRGETFETTSLFRKGCHRSVEEHTQHFVLVVQAVLAQ